MVAFRICALGLRISSLAMDRDNQIAFVDV